MDFYMKFMPKYNKKEMILLQLIVSNFISYKPLVFNIKEINLFKGKNMEEVELILNKFIKKSINYILKDERGIIQPFDRYSIVDRNIEFSLSVDFKDAILGNNRFKIFSLKDLIFFSNEFTKDFFYMFILGKEKNVFYISLDDFRNTFKLKEYLRFYDFERNILKVLISDINKYTNYSINYEKIKKTDFKNSRVIGINFNIINKNEEEKAQITNKLMAIAASKIKNYKNVYDIIYNNLNIYHETELELLIHRAAKEYKKNKNTFEEILKNILGKKNQFKFLKEFSGEFSTPIKLENQISSVLKELKINNFLEKEMESTKFLMKLYLVKEQKKFTFENDDILIIIDYNPKKESIVKIFKMA